MTLRTHLFSTVAAIGLSAVAAPAFAAACTGSNVGGADTTDVTFAGFASDACVVSGVNPQAGPDGDTSGFTGTFGSGWSMLGKVTSSDGSNSLGGVNFTWSFLQTTGTTGTWSLAASQSVMADFVFAMHASNNSGAFLFDDQAVYATTPGTWKIEWINNGQQVPDFSNLTLFARDITTPVPEPETYALFLAGLGAMGFVAKRRRKSA